MSETTRACVYVARDQPRVIPQRHEDGCEEDGCRGCLPCTEPHCRVCGIAHELTCGTCLDAVRTDLADVERMCANLPHEVIVKGVNSEAMNLLGPATDAEAWGHREASARAGRIDARYLGDATDEAHPLLVLGTWEMLYRDAYDCVTDDLVTVAKAAAYLDRNLSDFATNEHVPFEDMAHDLRRCVAHMERVLHDGDQVERTRVTCNNDHCTRRPRLVRKYGSAEHADRWVCPACKTSYDDGDYLDAHAQQLRHAGANRYLPIQEAVATLVTQGRSERTIRQWIADDKVRVRSAESTGRREVYWPDLWSLHQSTKTRMRKIA